MATGSHDVKLVGSSEKLGDIERSLTRRRASGLGANAREESRCGRPDARALTLFGREDAVQERNRGVMFTVPFSEFVH
jgi:hypothetical protein